MISKGFTADDLMCIRGDRLLFRHIRFTLKPGGLLYVLGDNGSGKSSLLRLLCGLMQPESGSICWQGEQVKHVLEVFQANLLYIGHLNGLKEDLSPIENLQASMRLAGDHADKPDVLDALEAIGVGRCANLPVRVLSQGQKRRVALARLWLTERKLWILDEPFATLDSTSIDVLVARINHHLNNDGMAIITTHQDVAISAQSTQVLRLDI
ncbi:MAG: cytochrome c biogenesis heme-transporting ATPase CcmA [Methylotenera sp.]